MTLTPAIIWIVLAALTTGFVAGYGVRSFVSSLRRRRARRRHHSMASGRHRRMEPQDDQAWRMSLENDLSQVTTAPTYDADASRVTNERPKIH